ncbi:hypothetical protein [Lysobacter xanthus]
MTWIVGVVVIAALHLAAIVAGRKTDTQIHRACFLSGLVGLLSFPLLAYVALNGLCVAGACGHGTDFALLFALAIFVGAAIVSAVSVVALGVRRSRA